MKRHIHLRSADGSGFPLLLKLKAEGHPVSLWVKAPESRHLGSGLVTKLAEPPRGALVVFDATGLHTHGAKYRKAGHLVIGGNALEQSLELDRPAGARIMRAAGIRTPETYPFSAIPAAITFLSKQDGAWFVKVSGDTVESSTCDAPNPDEIIRYLEWIQSRGSVDPFELQKTVGGTEISLNGWFNGREFIPPFDCTIEEKKLMDGDLGPRTGCESCIVWHAADESLAEKSVLLIEDNLAEAGYVGPVDLNCMVQPDGTPLGLEWTARLGFDSTQAWMRLFDGDLGEQMEAFADGSLTEWEPTKVGFSGTVRVTIPPYPAWDAKLIAKNKGLPLDDKVLDNPAFDAVDVMDGADGPESAGASGIVGTVGAVNATLAPLRVELLRVADKLEIPNKQHRTKLFVRADKDLKTLSELKLSGIKS